MLVPDRIPLPLQLHPLLPALSWAQFGGTVVHRRTVPAGGLLLCEGDAPTAVYLILAGALAVSVTSDAGRRAILDVVGPGEPWGQENLWRESGHSEASERGPAPQVQALVESVVASIPLSVADRAAQRRPEVRAWLWAELARRMGRIHRRLAENHLLPAKERIYGLLQQLAQANGSPVPGGTRVGIPLTQETLAAMAGVTRESANRAIRSLRIEGRIRQVGLSYDVVDVGPPASTAGRATAKPREVAGSPP